jgi:serine/threonine protein kinase
MWAAGIVTFQLIFGTHPNEDHSGSKIQMEKWLKHYSEITFPKTNETVSKAAKHMISKLCQKSVSGRFSPNDAL